MARMENIKVDNYQAEDLKKTTVSISMDCRGTSVQFQACQYIFTEAAIGGGQLDWKGCRRFYFIFYMVCNCVCILNCKIYQAKNRQQIAVGKETINPLDLA